MEVNTQYDDMLQAYGMELDEDEKRVLSLMHGLYTVWHSEQPEVVRSDNEYDIRCQVSEELIHAYDPKLDLPSFIEAAMGIYEYTIEIKTNNYLQFGKLFTLAIDADANQYLFLFSSNNILRGVFSEMAPVMLTDEQKALLKKCYKISPHYIS